ncbi:MAG: sulfite exporter TauE/SafE family protein [Bacteroidales bacterium]|nr:sulfite exporter TauE/SafE family protein [Bacteroidales bacterium]
MDWNLTALVGIGFAAGFINTLAGGGSLLALPFLMFLGLPANIANGTLRIAILLQNIVGVSSFKQQKVFNLKEGIWYSIPAAGGAIIGAIFAVKIENQIMEYIIGGLLVFMFFFIILKPDAWLKSKSTDISKKPTILQIIILFFVGLYGGFIQAGVGFFLLAALVLGVGLNLVKANAVKVFIVLIYTVFALGIFMFDGTVNYKYGFILAIGNMTGAFIASRFAVSWGSKFVRYILLIVLLGTSLEIFGVYDYLFALQS